MDKHNVRGNFTEERESINGEIERYVEIKRQQERAETAGGTRDWQKTRKKPLDASNRNQR